LLGEVVVSGGVVLAVSQKGDGVFNACRRERGCKCLVERCDEVVLAEVDVARVVDLVGVRLCSCRRTRI
jgi:hypothetical protein